MPAFEVIVQHRDGTPAVGARVALSAVGGGVTQESLSNSRGATVFTEVSTSEATVFVNGVKQHITRAGRTVVTI
ncbi:hypothetical protein HZA87_03320 [Candidatus Uhrbacteria bacterium]|nr:hypothetical protein [Candidatus Uhrbacteria bacterium]